MGNKRQLEETQINMASLYYFQGDFVKSLAHSSLTLQSARLRGDLHCQIIALSIQIACHLTLGNVQKAWTKLDQIRLAKESSLKSGDIASDMNYFGLMALVCLQRQEFLQSFDFVLKADDLITMTIDPTTYFTCFTYMAVPEVYLSFLKDTEQQKAAKTTHADLIKRLNKSMILLRKFADVFPFGKPRVHLLEGLSFIVTNISSQKAINSWNIGLELATKFKMEHEIHLLKTHIAQHQGRAQVRNELVEKKQKVRHHTRSRGAKSPRLAPPNNSISTDSEHK